MNAKKAHDVLKQHNEWRTDVDDVFNCPATIPKELTEALNFAIGVLSRMTGNDDEQAV